MPATAELMAFGVDASAGSEGEEEDVESAAGSAAGVGVLYVRRDCERKGVAHREARVVVLDGTTGVRRERRCVRHVRQIMAAGGMAWRIRYGREKGAQLIYYCANEPDL